MNEKSKVRETVSKAYARAVSAPKDEKTSCCCAPPQKGVVSKLAGYTREELAALPAEAVVNSFGCGNPLAFSEVRPGEVVLDLGSGAGIDILLAAKMVGPTGRVIGVDMTDEMIAAAHQNIKEAGLTNVEVRKGIIEDLPVDSSSVDWVISNCVINLSPEKPKVFAEIARVLKPGARMSVSDIVARNLPEWIRRDAALYSSCIAGAIGEEEYLAGLRAAGLVEIQVRERLVYDAAQMKAFVESELPDNRDAFKCCGSSGNQAIDKIVDALAGNIWSVKVFARKPGAA